MLVFPAYSSHLVGGVFTPSAGDSDLVQSTIHPQCLPTTGMGLGGLRDTINQVDVGFTAPGDTKFRGVKLPLGVPFSEPDRHFG